ncbi:MAG: GNAT family N-acetyltransferase [Deltaproteobacteria bacterium]|nr:GNAT family N-acetyltransferase [Deltaproteobacteria bacterium]
MKIDIRVITSANEGELARLYKDAGWWKKEYDEKSDFLKAIVPNSACFIGAFHENSLIGMGRALSDLSSDAYIQDVAVLKPFRGKGIGSKIIKKLVAFLKQHHVDWIGLVAKPNTSMFYMKLGFEILTDHVPLKFKG